MIKAIVGAVAAAVIAASLALTSNQIVIRNVNDCDNRPMPAACSGSGTPTLVQHVAGAMEDNAGNGVPSITAQLPNASLSGNALVLCVQMDQPGGVGVTISDNQSNTWQAGPSRVGTNQTLSLFYALNATAATRAITMTFSGATKPNRVQASISEFYNIATSSAADGSTGASSTTPIAAGSFTPTTSGDLIYHCGVNDANPGQYNGGTITAGSGFTLLNADRQNGTAAQYQVQSTAAAINPSFTVGADRWDSVAIALKSAAAGTVPSGMRIVHMQHSLLAWVDNAGRPNHATPVVLQFPSSGNLIVGLFNHSGYFLTGVTDSASNTWASAVQRLDSPAQVVSSQIVYAANATTSSTLNNLTFTFSQAVDVGHAMIVLYDITGAAASPLGATHSADGVQSVNANLSMDTITPTQTGSLVFNVGSIWGHTTNGTSGVALFDAWVNPIDNNAGGTIQTPASYLDMDNPYAHYLTPSTSPVTFTYSFNGTPPPTGIQQWSSVSAEFTADSPNPIAAVRQPAGNTSLPNTSWAATGVTGGIPSTSWTPCPAGTIAAGASRTTIQTAINGCGTNQYLQLGSGTFTLDGPPILKSNMELRGTSTAGTIVSVTGSTGSTWGFGGGEAALVIAGASGGYNADDYPGVGSLPSRDTRKKSWTGTGGVAGTYTQGTTVLNVACGGSCASTFAVGAMAVCWQDNADPATVPNSGLFFSEKQVDNPATDGISWNGEAADYNAGLEYRTLITASGTNQITVADPLPHPTGVWQTGRTPMCGYLTSSEVIQNAGLRNLTIDTSAWPGNHNCDVCIIRAANVWVQGVAIKSDVGTFHNGDSTDFEVALVDTVHATVKDNWFGHAIGGGQTTTTSYGVATQQAHFSRIENNIFDAVESPIEMLVGTMTNVLAYNYENWTGGQLEGGFQQHSIGTALNLFEGNKMMKFMADNWHGSSFAVTLLRNQMYSTGIDLWSYNRWYNALGNVLANTQHYQTLNTDAVKIWRFDSTCWRLGYNGQGPSIDPNYNGSTLQDGVAADSVVHQSLFRWGNYCFFDASLRFNSSDVPSSDPQFPNPVPSTNTVPKSLYLTGKPSWWPSAKAWPSIGPDVTGGTQTNTGGHANTTPAEDCFTAASGNMANFNPASCYSGS